MKKIKLPIRTQIKIQIVVLIINLSFLAYQIIDIYNKT